LTEVINTSSNKTTVRQNKIQLKIQEQVFIDQTAELTRVTEEITYLEAE
jgi:hypothetical protein